MRGSSTRFFRLSRRLLPRRSGISKVQPLSSTWPKCSTTPSAMTPGSSSSSSTIRRRGPGRWRARASRRATARGRTAGSRAGRVPGRTRSLRTDALSSAGLWWYPRPRRSSTSGFRTGPTPCDCCGRTGPPRWWATARSTTPSISAAHPRPTSPPDSPSPASPTTPTRGRTRSIFAPRRPRPGARTSRRATSRWCRARSCSRPSNHR